MDYIKQELGFGIGRDDNNTIRIGGGCLKLEDGVLKLCNATCSSCTTVWDHTQAPTPTLPT